MSKKGLLLASIMCGALIPTLMISHCGECGCTIKDECKAEENAELLGILASVVAKKYFGVVKKSRPDQKELEKLALLHKRGFFKDLAGLADVLLEGFQNVLNTARVESEIAGEELEELLSLVRDDLGEYIDTNRRLDKVVSESKKGKAEPTSLKEEITKEESEEKLIDQL